MWIYTYVCIHIHTHTHIYILTPLEWVVANIPSSTCGSCLQNSSTNLTEKPLYGKAAIHARICFFCRDVDEDLNLLILYLQAPNRIVCSISTGVMMYSEEKQVHAYRVVVVVESLFNNQNNWILWFCPHFNEQGLSAGYSLVEGTHAFLEHLSLSPKEWKKPSAGCANLRLLITTVPITEMTAFWQLAAHRPSQS